MKMDGFMSESGESCVPSCKHDALAGSCTELRCPPSGPEPACLDDLNADTWWVPCGYGGECQRPIELGTVGWEDFGFYSCGPPGPSACQSVDEVQLPRSESALQRLDLWTAVAFGYLALLARLSRSVSECISYSWFRGCLARALYAKVALQWSPANLAGVGCIAALFIWLCLLPISQKSSGIATGFALLLTLWWSFFRGGVHNYVFMTREAAWRIHYSLGLLAIIVAAVHGALNLAEHGLYRLLSTFHLLCGVLSLLAVVVAVVPATLLTYDRFKRLHFLSLVGYLLALAHMVGHAIQLQTLASILMAASSAFVFLLYAIQKLYVHLSQRDVEIQSANMVSDSSGEHLFLSLAVKDFSFKAGQWGHLLADQVSSVPHPFTLVPGDGTANVQIFLKVYGGFTDKLAEACRDAKQLPKLKLQGPYGLPAMPLPGITETVFVVGGIGVTPALSLAPAASAHAKVAMFWSLRSSALLERVAPLLEDHLDPVRSCVQVTLPSEAVGSLPLMAEYRSKRDALDVGNWLTGLGKRFTAEGICQVMVFVCGPPRLVAATKAAASRRAGGLAWHVHVEEFRFLPCTRSSPEPRALSQPVEPRIYGQSEEFFDVQPLNQELDRPRAELGSCAAFCGPRLASLLS